MRNILFATCCFLICQKSFEASYVSEATNTILVQVSPTLIQNKTLRGRLLVYVSKTNSTEPIFGNGDEQSTNQMFGVNVDLQFSTIPSEPITVGTIDESVLGFPRDSIADILKERYYVQAEFRNYKIYKRQALPDTLLPTTCVSAAGQNGQYAKPDGTLLSAVHIWDMKLQSELKITLDKKQPPAKSPGCAGLGDAVDSEWIKTFRIKSSLLSAWWNMDITLEACVLIPYGFHDQEHNNASYPLVIAHGHYSPQFFPGGGFQTKKPECDPAVDGYSCVQQLYSYYLYKNWTSTEKDAPFTGARMILVTLNHPTPFFDDSYAVDSENSGPYGSAITQELIPAIEKEFRGVGARWARGAFGGSTGGWESFASAVLYPDVYNFAAAACPDPVTFSQYTTIDIYNQRNAFYYDSVFKRTHLPGYRDGYSGETFPGYKTPYGQIIATVEEMNRRELVLGTNGRSCEQYDVWETTFSPVCENGFQCRLYNKATGEINRTVAKHWMLNWDLAHKLVNNETLLSMMDGMLHVFVGASDSFYLDNAVINAKEAVESAAKAKLGKESSGIEWVFGAHEGLGLNHCFRGYEYASDGTVLPNSLTRLSYAQAFFPLMAKRFVETAPAGSDISTWRY